MQNEEIYLNFTESVDIFKKICYSHICDVRARQNAEVINFGVVKF